MNPARLPQYLALTATLLLSCPAPGGDGLADAPPALAAPPNVVLIVVDDPGHRDFGPSPPPGFEIPHMASIAAEGVRFTQAYSCASVCSPARAGLLTGRYPQRFGHEYNPPRAGLDIHGLPAFETTLAEVLRDRGYRTIAVGKWHLGFGVKHDPLGSGFDEFWGFLSGSRRHFPLKEERLNRTNRLRHGREMLDEDFDYLTDAFAREAEWAIERNRENPFFLYLSFSALHQPMQAPAEVLARVEGVEDEDRRVLAAMTLSLDEAVGRVLAALERLDLDERTIVALVGDNGGSLENSGDNTPLRGAKGQFFEGAVRVPFFLRWPDLAEPGRVHAGMVSTLDLFPTILCAVGGDPASLEAPLDGVDLAPLLAADAARPGHERLCWRRGEEWAVRQGDWKLVGHLEAEPMLFHLAEDPSERHDLASVHPDRAAGLRGAWESWNAEMKAPRWTRHREEDE